jgi:gamma-glutamyltranspeptidase/glutathione hydrolase
VYVAAEKRTYVYDFRETGPAAIAPAQFTDPQAARVGGLAVAIPGELAGLHQMQAEHGAIGWADDVSPAAALARGGVAVDAWLAHVGATTKAPDGAPYDRLRAMLAQIATGTLTRPELARLLDDVAARGPAAFYTGPVAQRIVDLVHATGGVMTLDDLARYAVDTPAPLVGAWRGHTIVTMPLPSSGGVILLEALGLLDALDARGVHLGPPGSALTLHLMSEVLEHGFADRARLLGDEASANALVAHILDPHDLATIAARIDPDHVAPHDSYGHTEIAPNAPPPVDHGTSHLCVVDGAGNAVALTTTVNAVFGAKLVTEDGVVLDDEIDDFALAPGATNQFGLVQGAMNVVAPGKRPLSTMTPVLVLDGDRVIGCAGGSGGPHIATNVTLALVNALAFGDSAADAIGAPRVHHQWMPDVLEVEPGVPDDVVASLRARGHTVKVSDAVTAVQMILVRADGTLDAAADQRKLQYVLPR